MQETVGDNAHILRQKKLNRLLIDGGLRGGISRRGGEGGGLSGKIIFQFSNFGHL